MLQATPLRGQTPGRRHLALNRRHGETTIVRSAPIRRNAADRMAGDAQDQEKAAEYRQFGTGYKRRKLGALQPKTYMIDSIMTKTHSIP